MANSQSKIVLLEEQNSKLVAEITELKREKAEFLAKEAGFMARIMELEQIAEKAKLRDTELNTRIMELERSSEKRFAKLEQNQNNTVVKLENDDSSSEKDINVPDSVINKYIDHVSSADTNARSLEDDTPASDITDNASNSDVYLEPSSQMEVGSHQYSALPIHTELKSLEEKEEDEFLDSTYKEQVSKEIIQSIREKKFRDQNLSSDNSSKPSNSSRDIKTVPSGNDQVSNSSCETKTICSGNDQTEISELEQDDGTDKNQIVEQGLIEELGISTEKQGLMILGSPFGPDSAIDNTSSTEINTSENKCSAQHLSYLFKTAIKSRQEEIINWYYYSLEFENKIYTITAD
ncbi:5636_t:CDS:1, partial [Diversispora eburnea]